MKKFVNPLTTLVLTLLMYQGTALAQSPGRDAATEVRDSVIAFNQSYEMNDLDAYFSYYRPDTGLLFDSGRVTLNDYKTMWHGLIEQGGGVQSNVISDLQIVIDALGDTAIATYQLDVDTLQPDGTVTREHALETDIWMNTDGQWRVAHVHYTAKPRE